jgi:hypothetical protein
MASIADPVTGVISKRTIMSKQCMTYCHWRYLRNPGIAQTDHLSQPCRKVSYLSSDMAMTSPPARVDDVFEKYHSQLETNSFQAKSFIEFSSELCRAVYSSLSWLPWLHNENYVIAYMQLFMNGRTKDLLTEPLYSQKHFSEICDHIVNHVSEIPGKDSPTLLLSLLYCGLEQTDPVALRLLAHCHESTNEFDIAQLRDCAYLLQSLGAKDFILVQKIISRLSDIMTQHPADLKINIEDLCAPNPVLAAYMNQELFEKCVFTILYKVNMTYQIYFIFYSA